VSGQVEFSGMPDEGLAFLEDLEERNTKEFFDAHKQVFLQQVQAPFAALLDAACGRLRRSVPGLGRPKVFRIYRDLRFSKDRTPYQTSMRAWVAHPSGGGGSGGLKDSPPANRLETGYYVDVGPDGMYAGGGRYHWERPELERLRAAVADPEAGEELARILRRATRKGMEPWLDPLQRMPRPYPADHPRAELLRARSLTVGRRRQRGPWLLTGELLDHLVEDWRALVPLNRWLERL
jgi:uncharacterized protein (TIGR02453 family)